VSEVQFRDTVGEHPDFGNTGFAWRDLPDGRTVVWYEMLFNYRIVIGSTGDRRFDDGWCYAANKFVECLEAVTNWDGNGDPPNGWHKQLSTGRRRTNGDPAAEYVAR
jgi:hypothetical protein